VVAPCRRPLSEANAFLRAAGTYWLEVFPHVKQEVRYWRRRAARVRDKRLARLALETQMHERGNLEGAAVFALLAPRRLRAEVVRAAVSFQALYDFLDTLAELPVADPVANGRRLHAALLAALEPGASTRGGFLEHCGFEEADGGYVEELIAACQDALAALPAYAHVAGPARAAAVRMVDYQSFNHFATGEPLQIRRWGSSIAPAGSGLRWWEAAAGAASSLGVFALLAAAASPNFNSPAAAETAEAYFPWVGALHVLLDSLVDFERDLDCGDHSLVSHYSSAGEAAERLGAIAAEAAERLCELGRTHSLILSAMAGFYLSRPAARGDFAAPAAARIVDELGPWTGPAIAVSRARRTARVLSRKSSSGLSTCLTNGVK